MEITAVPLQPTPKGVMTKLWLGVAACVVLAGGLAWATTQSAAQGGASGAACGKLAFAPVTGSTSAPVLLPSGLRMQTVQAGKGPMPTAEDFALVAYKGALKDGSVFDEQPKAVFPVSQVVPGFSEGLQHMQAGGVYRLCIPGALGYGAAGVGNGKIPPNATLLFIVQLLDFKTPAEVQAMKTQAPQGQPTSGAGAGGATN